MASGFKDKTPEEMKEIRKRIFEGTNRHYANRTSEYIRQESTNKSKATQAYWNSLAYEEKEQRLVTSFHSPDALERSSRHMKDMPKEERRARARRTFDSPEALKKRQANFDAMTQEQKRKWAERSFLQSDARQRSALHNPKLPAASEVSLQAFLDEHFPKLFGYNGNGCLGVFVQNRVPDFVRLDGKRRQVISLLNDSFADLGKMIDEVAHYNQNGYDCLILWTSQLEDIQTLRQKVQAFI